MLDTSNTWSDCGKFHDTVSGIEIAGAGVYSKEPKEMIFCRLFPWSSLDCTDS